MDSEEEYAAAAVIIAVNSKRRKEQKKRRKGKNRGCEEETICAFITLLSRNFKRRIDLNTVLEIKYKKLLQNFSSRFPAMADIIRQTLYLTLYGKKLHAQQK